ncbi:MAG TPA: hypothetical protein VM513_26520 [Kofleriaceae bacterium]|nr:hypothetical protein [Kofleriaceae bacterium]
MKKLVLSSLMTVLVSQAAGCVISSGEEDARITAQWSLKSLADNAAIPYPPGTTTAAVYSQEVDASFRPIGQPIIDLFDVEDNAGTTAALPPSVYQVWVELTSEGGSNVFARSLSAYVDVIDTDKTFTTTILEDGGYFQLSWNLVDAGGAPASCSVTNGVGVLSTLTGPNTFRDDKFDCEDGGGITAGLLNGTYTVEVSALGPDDGSIGDAPLMDAKVIGDRNQVTDLGTTTITLF